MKQTIKFFADDSLLPLIKRWQDYLLKERLYSEHTLDAYSRDLAIFLQKISQDEKIGLEYLEKLDVRDFRRFLSKRAAQNINKSSVGRELSAVRSFFKWLDTNNIMKTAL